MKFLEGKKTYIVMAVGIILSAIDTYNAQCVGEACQNLDVPTWVYGVLSGLGVWTRKVAK